MTRIAMWTSLGAASLMDDAAVKAMGYSDVVLQTNSVVKAGQNTFSQWPAWGKPVVDELHAAGLKAFLGCRVHGLNSPIPWFYDWADDANWNAYVKPAWTAFCMVLRNNGLDGIALDEELSGNNGEWVFGGGYPNPFGLTKAQAEAKAYQRGQELNDILVYLCGVNVEVLSYSCYWPGGYSDWLQWVAGNTPNMGPSAPTLEHHFWRGWFSRNHHGHTWFGNANFYKGVVTGTKAGITVYPTGFAGAMNYDQRVKTQFWPAFLDPGTDLTKIHITPMIAVSPIEHASTSFHATMAPASVAAQLDAAARSSEGLIIDYHYGDWPYVYDAQNIDGRTAGDTFSYSPFVSSLQAAAAVGGDPGRVVTLTATVTDVAGNVSAPKTFTLPIHA